MESGQLSHSEASKNKIFSNRLAIKLTDPKHLQNDLELSNNA